MTSRITTRYLDLEPDLGVQFTHIDRAGAHKNWVPTRVEEELRETDNPIGTDAPTSEYKVRVTGPVLKKDGTPGQVTRSRVFGARWGHEGDGIDDVPAPVSERLLGESGLRDWKP